MCQFCEKIVGCEYVIQTKKYQRDKIYICPNCVAVKIYEGTLKFEKGSYTNEIDGKQNAIKIGSVLFGVKPFYVSNKQAIRLLGHALMPEEYKALLKSHSETEYELHDDFYDLDGAVLQPVNEDEYEENLENGVKDEESLDDLLKKGKSFKEINTVYKEDER